MTTNDGQSQNLSSHGLNMEFLAWVVGGGVIILALLQYINISSTWLLLMGGTIILAIAIYRTWDNIRQSINIKQFLMQIGPRRGWVIMGGLLILIGLVARFGPRDIGTVLSLIGLVLMIGGIWYLALASSSEISSPQSSMVTFSNPDQAELETDGNNRLSQAFRLRVAETVFRNAKNTSMMNFIVGLIFFVVGIGLFIYLAYEVFQIQRTGVFSSQDDRLNQLFEQSLTYIMNASQGQPFENVLQQLSPLFLLILRDMLGRILIPIVSLIIIAWIGGRLIFNATRLSQRRVIREALEELGPLQDTLAGIPPRKPFLQVVDQGLRQTRRAFTIRLWLSILLGVVGIALLITTAIRALQPNATDVLTTATVGASGVVSFIVSLVTTRQKEIGENLIQVIQEETRVAQNAQRSEIVDLYVAQLLRGAKPQQLNGILDVLDRLKESSSTEPPAKTTLSKSEIVSG